MKKFEKPLTIILFTVVIWLGVSTSIQAFMCDEMTNTQLLKNVPNHFLFDFKNC